MFTLTLLIGLNAPVSAPSVTTHAHWSDAAVLAASVGGYFALHSRKEPLFKPEWASTERGLSYNEDTVPTSTFYVWGGALSAASGLEGGPREAVSALQTLSLTALGTEILKQSFGRPRPDYEDRMRRHAQTGDPKLLADARMSMPSGHSSSAFALALHTSLWAHRAACRRGYGAATIALGWGVPLSTAAAIGVSRITDHRHNISDVVAGALIGLGMSWGVNRVQFGPWKGCP
jgi:membrane-associated phospholipid phosphatase